MSEPVYVVMVNFNGWKDTVECLESVLRSDHPGLHALVVDNGSHDDSLKRLAAWATGAEPGSSGESEALRALTSPPVAKPVDHAIVTPDTLSSLDPRTLPRVLFIDTGSNLGFAGGNNVALRFLLRAGADGHACLINNDMVVDPRAIGAMVEASRADLTLGAVGGVILEYYRPGVVESLGGGDMSRLGMSHLRGVGLRREQVTSPGALGYVNGGCLLAPLRVLREVGLLEERYFLYAEDADWGTRMRQRGYRLACATAAFVWHKGSRATGARSPFQDYYLVRSTLMFVRAHAGRFLPLAIMYSVYRSLFPKLVRREWTRARAVFRAYSDFARGV